jgi:hypothetical protein
LEGLLTGGEREQILARVAKNKSPLGAVVKRVANGSGIASCAPEENKDGPVGTSGRSL